MTGNQYFQPVNLGGIDTFTASGQNGWYQFDVPDPLVPVLPGITVPANATGFVLQANTAIAYCFSPEEADLGTTAWLSLPAGGSVVVSGKQWVRQFCVRLGLVANASFTVQFLTGNIGPILEINAPVTGGIIPPPPPGLSAVITTNVLHVMPTGDDATGTPYRLDLPYATPAAAEAAAIAGDAIMFWAGTYVGANLGKDGVTYIFQGAVLQDDGTNPIFSGSPVQPVAITGTGLIQAFNGAPYAIDVVPQTDYRLEVPVESGAGGVRVAQGGGTFYLDTELNCGLEVTFGNVKAQGAFNAGVLITGALANCSVVGDVLGGVTADQSSRLSIQGNITGNVLADNSATITVRGTITGTVVSSNSATLNQQGPVVGNCTANSKSTMYITGNVQGGLLADQSLQVVVGNVDAGASGVNAENGADQYINGNIISAGVNAVVCNASLQVVTGEVETDAVGLNTKAGGILRFTGRVRSTGGLAAYCQDGVLEIHGTAISDTDFGAQILAGTIRITGRIESCRACLAIEDSTATYTAILGAGTVLVADTGACAAIASVVTLDSNPVNVVCMGVYANLAFEPAVTALVQAPVVNVNVQ